MNLHTNINIKKTEAISSNGMVATKDKLSSQIGVDILKLGGNAVDAGIAACLAVGVVEPESSGIGGGGYMVFQVEDKGGVIGFPMKGPLQATPDMYTLTGEDKVGNFGWAGVVNDENIHGYRSIAVPGCVAGLLEAHKRFGRLPLSEIVNPAIDLARKGFYPEWFTLYKFGWLTEMLLRYEELGKTFMPNGILPFGTQESAFLLKQPDLANSLEIIKKYGHDGFYKGEISENIVSDVQKNNGILTLEDFKNYKPFYWESGLEFQYRDKIIRVPPFASAGITSAMTMKLLNHSNIKEMGHNSADMLHTYISAAKMAYEDRFEYLADPEFTDVPWKGLISDDYTKDRFNQLLINGSTYTHGDPWKYEGRKPYEKLKGSSPSPDNGTTHLSIIDGDGNAVAITNTIMSGFGSGIIPKRTGIVMNNGMMWYDPIPGRVNSISPGKYPLNNMTPALVFNKDGIEMSLGATGGRRITNCVTSLLVNLIDFNMSPQEAIDAPRIDCSSSKITIDPRINKKAISRLEELGHSVNVLGSDYSQSRFGQLASPVAVTKQNGIFKGGVDTFHAAYAAGL